MRAAAALRGYLPTLLATVLVLLAGTGVALADGACCNAGACSVTSSADCTSVGGVFIGEGTSCSDPLQCEKHACCSGLTCSRMVTSACLAVGGIPLPPLLCTGVDCAAGGACCSADSCTEVVTESDCLPPFVFTLRVNCTDIGACCLDTGTRCEECYRPAACTAAGGVFGGATVACRAVDCTMGPCCNPVARTCAVSTPIACPLTSVFGEPGTTCAGVGACCIPGSGTCEECTSATSCTALGGLYQGAGSSCGGVDCSLGGCCKGRCIEDETRLSCEAGGGEFLGADRRCSSGDCGPCCSPVPALGCTDEQTVAECMAAGGTVGSLGGQCAGAGVDPFYGVGACCQPEVPGDPFSPRTCVDCQRELACKLNGGTFRGVGSLCSDASIVCDSGSCCSPSGCAAAVAPSACGASGGLAWAAPPATCASFGACCNAATGACTGCQTATGCALSGGAFQGVGTSCSGPFCSSPGACCSGTSCAPAASAAACAGSFAGAGTTCGSVGACCREDGVCQSCTSSAECTVRYRGYWHGAGTVCGVGGVGCTATGACCVDALTCTTGVSTAACLTMPGGHVWAPTCAGLSAAGACVFADTCEDCRLLASCEADGGAFLGPGSKCPPPRDSSGACCGDGSMLSGCADELSGPACDAAGGVYDGVGEICATRADIRGACCDTLRGTCNSCSDAGSCAALEAGVFHGVGSRCSSVVCSSLFGACCGATIPGGCRDLVEPAACAGDFAGLGTSCRDGVCGSCCGSDGGCVDDASRAGCFAGGGAAFEPGGSCPAACGVCCEGPGCAPSSGSECADGEYTPGASCDVVGACCDATGACVDDCVSSPAMCMGDFVPGETCGTAGVCLGACCDGGEPTSCGEGVDRPTCEATGGRVFGGAGSSCAEVGACTLPGRCIGCATAAGCALAGGVFGGTGSSCDGACCTASGCVVVDDAPACTALGGVFGGAATLCSTTGACCSAGTGCTSCRTRAGCEAGGGIYRGDMSTCVGVDCLLGACCRTTGCTSGSTAGACTSTGGVFKGAGSTCAALGACCNPTTFVCTNCTSAAECVASGGIYQADGRSCDTVDCTRGACCTRATGCLDGRLESECETGMTPETGVFGGPGSVCAGPDCCARGVIYALAALTAVKDPPLVSLDVRLRWTTDIVADMYNGYYVTMKSDIPLASMAGLPLPAVVVPGCASVATATCKHFGAVPGLAGSIHYYNVLGACLDGSEAAE